MRLGLAISAMLHAMLLAWAMVSIAQTREFKIPEPDPIISDIVSESDLVRLRQGTREAKLDNAAAKDVPKPDEAKKEPPKPRPVAAPPPPPPPAAEPPPPEPEVTPPQPPKAAEAPPPEPAPKVAPTEQAALDKKLDELAMERVIEADKQQAEAAAKAKAAAEAEAKAKADAEAKAKAEADAKKKAEEKKRRELLAAKRKAEEKRKADLAAKEKAKFDSSRISALLDKTPDPKQAPAAAPPPTAPTKAVGPVKGDKDGRDATNSATEGAMLGAMMRQAVQRCWNINAGLEGIDKVVVTLEFRLTRDGRLNGQPRVINQQSSPVFRDAADSALRALVQCEPYALPPDKYERWQHMVINFDPARMF